MIREMREKGCYLREIAEEVGCSERTVRRALLRGGPPPRRRSGIRSSKLDPYKAQVDRLLAEGVWNATVIFAEIQAMGYRGGISILRDYIRPKRALRKPKGTVRFETAPGRQLHLAACRVKSGWTTRKQRCLPTGSMEACGSIRAF